MKWYIQIVYNFKVNLANSCWVLHFFVEAKIIISPIYGCDLSQISLQFELKLRLFQMCVVGFNVVDLELAVGVAGEDITMTMIADHVIPREYGNVAVDKFQAKFSSGNWSLNLS